MSNTRWILNDQARNGSITATSAATGLPANNLRDSRRSYPWRSTSTATQTLVGTVGGMSGLCGVVLSNSNLRTTAAISVVLKSGGAVVGSAAMLCAGTNVDGTTTWVGWPTATATATSYEITVADAGNPAGYLQAVQVVAGEAVVPVNNIGYGMELAWVEDVRHVMTASQSMRSEGTGTVRRQVTLNYELMSEADRALFSSELAQAGRGASIFVSVYPSADNATRQHTAFVGRRMDDIAQTHWAYQFWRQGMVVREV